MKNKKIQPGDQFEQLTVTRYLGESNWECKCSCGNITVAKTGKLTTGSKTRCEECVKNHNKRVIDLTNQVIGHWKVLEYAGYKYWKCECLLCNNIYEVRGSSLRNNTSLCCVDCANKKQSVPKIDLTGQLFGDLKAIKYLGKSMWECKCSCGAIVNIRSDNLLSSEITCCNNKNLHDTDLNLTGRQFSNWKVIRYKGNSKWECKCSCGAIRDVSSWSLRSGVSNSCGGPQHRLKYHLTGFRFGSLIADEYLDNMEYRCKCECGNTVNILTANLINGSTRSCGCKTSELRNLTMLGRYGDVSWHKVQSGKLRADWQINALMNKQDFIKVIEEHTNNGTKPSNSEIAKILSISTHYVNIKAKEFNCLDLLAKQSELGTSRMENEIYNYIISLIPNEVVIQSDRTILNGLEVDIYIPNRKIALEINGNYWHSDLFKDPDYHQKKTIACGKKGIRLIHIFEYEWNNLEFQEKLKTFLKDILDDNKNRVYARNCVVKQIEYIESSEFLNRYHLQGNTASSIQYGIYKDSNLLGVMTFGKPRFNNQYEYELIRSCWKPGTIVIGGKEKLFSTFINEYNPSSIISYCDESKFIGNSYIKLGFKVDGKKLTSPSYVWVNRYTNEIMSRYQSQKHRLVNKGLADSNQSEREALSSVGYLRIYDCGCIRFIWKKDNT